MSESAAGDITAPRDLQRGNLSVIVFRTVFAEAAIGGDRVCGAVLRFGHPT
jgi:hypothetical protein